MLISRFPVAEELPELLARPTSDIEDLRQTVREVFEAVRFEGVQAVRRYSMRWDGVAPENLLVEAPLFADAEQQIDEDLKAAIVRAAEAIRTYHESQQQDVRAVETAPGVKLWREARAIEKVGLYVPGGSAPLFSSLLMTAIPAQIAGCREIVICTPPGLDGNPDPALLFAAKVCGIEKVFRLGGIQAIAAMTLGVDLIPAVDKIFGPGSAAVSEAKSYALQLGTAIDLPAGPSEVLVIAGPEVSPEVIASDLLAQAEHGPDAQVIMVTWNNALLEGTERAIRNQLGSLPRAEIASRALDNARLILVRDAEEAIRISNAYAPEHLILASRDARRLARSVVNAGSVFLGLWSPETAGDYATGGNHCLPTGGAARAWSGLGLSDFQRQISFQELSPEGLQDLAPTLMTLARGEKLEAHARAVSTRLGELSESEKKKLSYAG